MTTNQKIDLEPRIAEGKVFLQEDFLIEADDAVSCIEETGTFVVTKMDKLDEKLKPLVVSTNAEFVLDLVGEIDKIVVSLHGVRVAFC